MSYADYDPVRRLQPEPLAGAERARDRSGREVRIRRWRTADELFRQRFHRHAESWRSLRHPAVVPVVEIGEHEGKPYLVEEIPPGRGLAARLAQGDLALEARIDLLTRIAECLEEAHRRGVGHHGLTVSEVMVASDGTPRVAGFGVGRLFAAAAVEERPAEVQLEIVAARPPEELLGGEPGTGGDVYAFGVLAYEVIAGSAPFAIESLESLMAAKMGRGPRPLAAVRPECPRALEELVESCMAPDPADRPADFATVRRRLDGLDLPSTNARERRSTAPGGSSAVADRVRLRVGRPAIAALAGALLLGALGTAVILYLGGGEDAPAPPPGPVLTAAEAIATGGAGAARGVLAIDARPWGEIVGIVDFRGDAVALPSLRYTPVSLPVAAGSYEVSIRRPDRVEAETCSAVVTDESVGECLVEFFSVSAQQYFRESGWWR